MLHPYCLEFYHLSPLFADYGNTEVLFLGLRFWGFLFFTLKKATTSTAVQPAFTMCLLGRLHTPCGLHG